MTFTPPEKRTTGQCSDECQWRRDALGPTTDHLSDCPALYPLPPQPGDEPDALTKLTRLVRNSAMMDWQAEQALTLISQAAEERKALEAGATRLDALAGAANQHVDALKVALAASQEVVTALSNKATAALRMGQQQGRVELAEELLEGLNGPTAIGSIMDRLEAIVREDT